MKGIAIILMVIGHAEAPELVTNFIYTFHMPLFFMAAGYFFDRKYLSDPWTFCRKRFAGLYVPFVKWAIVFLLLHNVWHHFGILNESYGNWTGGVTHPYGWNEFLRRLMLIVTSMWGYDEFMAGAFWFFRGLLVASILFLVFYMILEEQTRFKGAAAVVCICLGAIVFTAFHIFSGTRLPIIPNGGWREVWGVFFFGAGVLYRQYKDNIPVNFMTFAICLIITAGGGYFHLSGMNNSGMYRDLWSLPLTGCAGFLMLRYVAGLIDSRDNALRRALVYTGNNTLYIFIFHIIAFKLVSIAKIAWYDLDPAQIGCHMVIHYRHTDFFWVIYSIVGVVVPLAGLEAVRALRTIASAKVLKVLKNN